MSGPKKNHKLPATNGHHLSSSEGDDATSSGEEFVTIPNTAFVPKAKASEPEVQAQTKPGEGKVDPKAIKKPREEAAFRCLGKNDRDPSKTPSHEPATPKYYYHAMNVDEN